MVISLDIDTLHIHLDFHTTAGLGETQHKLNQPHVKVNWWSENLSAGPEKRLKEMQGKVSSGWVLITHFHWVMMEWSSSSCPLSVYCLSPQGLSEGRTEIKTNHSPPTVLRQETGPTPGPPAVQAQPAASSCRERTHQLHGHQEPKVKPSARMWSRVSIANTILAFNYNFSFKLGNIVTNL